MEYSIIDKDTWKRKEYFEHYFSRNPCTYSFTTKLNITKLRKKGLKLYPTMLYLLTKTVNKYEEFRMNFRNDKELILFANMEPCYTIFHKETETFSNIWTEYSEDYHTFCMNYEEDMKKYGKSEGMIGKKNIPENSFTVSMIPWTTFDGFNLNIKDYKYLLPIFTIGKYYEEEEQVWLPFAIQVHHAVCDGYHTCRFVNDIQSQLNEI